MKESPSYIRIREGKVAETRELGDTGDVFADYDAAGNIIGIEFLSHFTIEDIDVEETRE